ncbi:MULTISPECIES: aldo/keto reductase [Kocuria]|uniref:Putative aldo-keto reductase n=1 Tax=Kocuria rhizophila (strain ATCC 9341 / DSM 348 / NBRC 103217 / DC2201) TaxID=378753 RepID=B2GGM4_KOCRD|nr:MULTISPECIES: aldo/keto reductase [Kocuria]HAG63688.1 aldo/keto reductase [Kocuria sp.]ASE11916.1 aldo/keto reductase [Kocuria rhizophila]MBS6030782.1 aldo/keto reductase [Kocuria rhizophila]MCC5672055.1 aldo/keto reductase [Kocuria rhizophila]MCC5673691.1 aldo/keto reductase [Kocuria rhizophila]
MSQHAPTTARIAGIEQEIFRLNLGGNTFGWTSDEQQSFDVLDTFVAAGGNFVDTADMYSVWAEGHEGGESETVLGRWFAARGNRDSVVLATKTGAHPQFRGLAHDTVVASLEASLDRLQTGYVDLYYAHYDDADTPIEQQVETFHELVDSGRVHAVGLSNYSPQRMREFFTVARERGMAVPAAIQPQYNLVHRRDFERDYAAIAQEYDAAVFPYFSLASGFLTGKYRTTDDLEGAAREQMAREYVSPEGFAVVEELVSVADRHRAEPATVALAWLLAKGVTAPIASASSAAQLSSLVAAPALHLGADDIAALDRVSQPFA